MAIVFIPRGIHNAYNEGAEKARNNMDKEDLKEILITEIFVVIASAITAICCILSALIDYRASYYFGTSILSFVAIIAITIIGCMCRNINISINEIMNFKEDNK